MSRMIYLLNHQECCFESTGFLMDEVVLSSKGWCAPSPSQFLWTNISWGLVYMKARFSAETSPHTQLIEFCSFLLTLYKKYMTMCIHLLLLKGILGRVEISSVDQLALCNFKYWLLKTDFQTMWQWDSGWIPILSLAFKSMALKPQYRLPWKVIVYDKGFPQNQFFFYNSKFRISNKI